MKSIVVAAGCLALSGCAIFGGGEKSARFEAASARSGKAALSAAPSEGFRPAFTAGHPTALVPCRAGAVSPDGCSATMIRHPAADQRAPEGAETDLAAPLIAPASD